MIRKGTKIPWTIDPGEKLRVPSYKQLDLIVKTCNALLNAKVVKSGQAGLEISDHNMIISLEDIIGAGSNGYEPFEIIQPYSGKTDFRKIQVNAGNYYLYGLTETMTRDFSGSHITAGVTNFNTNITCPASAAVYVYLGYSGGGWGIFATATDDGSWVEYGRTDNDHIVIGFIDALTQAGSKKLLVSQYLLGHQYAAIDGYMTNGSIFPRAVVFDGYYNSAKLYFKNQSTVLGVVADGFPADGTYIYVGIGSGIGPNNGWLRYG